jgi:hypothetical protein
MARTIRRFRVFLMTGLIAVSIGARAQYDGG